MPSKVTEVLSGIQEILDFINKNKTHLMGIALIALGVVRFASGDITMQAFLNESWQMFLGGGLMTLKQDGKNETDKTVARLSEPIREVATKIDHQQT